MSSYAATHRRSLEARDDFWRERASLIHWQTPFTDVLDYSRPPFARWFVGGRTNLCYNAVDRHLADCFRWVRDPLAAWLLDRWTAADHRSFHYEIKGSSLADFEVVAASEG